MADRKSMQKTTPPPGPVRRSRQYSNPDVFSDEHALDTLDFSDPSPTDVAGAIEQSTQRRSIGRPIPSQRTSQSRLSSLRRSNYSYGMEDDNPTFSPLRHSQSSASNTGPLPSGSVRREPSNASTSIMPRPQSPYRGATGPSHPYAMYSQDNDIGIGRAPSNATTSTMRTPLQNYSGPSGPSHPYGMYAQNTASAEDLAANTVPFQQAPVTNAGPSHTYQRRLGPDGEDADDLIGPDGHTEQLPPYTKYPNDLPPKERIAIPERVETAAEAPPQDSQETLHNSPAGYAESRNLVFRPADTQPNLAHGGIPEDPSEARSPIHIETPHSQTSLSTDEGGNLKEVVPAGRKRRIWNRIPMRYRVGAVLLLVAIIIGGVVGGYFRRKSWEHKIAVAQAAQPPAATVTITTSLIDAEPVPTPSDLSPLPIGTFALPLQSPSPSSNACLSGIQASAWTCADGSSVNLEVISGGNEMPQVSIVSVPQPGRIRYGAQPPQMAFPANLMVMRDKNEYRKGAAYFFQQLITKVVVVRDEEIAFGPSARRSLQNSEVAKVIAGRGRGGGYRDKFARAGTFPWYCFWNNTTLEGFIYANQTNDEAFTTMSDTMSTTFGVSGSGLSPAHGAASATINAADSSSTAGDSGFRSQVTESPFPKLIKLEERRTQFSPTPYCQQMQILNNGDPVPKIGSMQQELDEDEPMQQNRLLYGGGPRQRRAADEAPSISLKDDVTGPCQCQWYNT